MRFRKKLLVCIAAFGAAGGAQGASLTGSSPGFHYFYKQGADMEAHDEALVDCAVRLRAMVNGSDAMTAISASTGGGLLGALVGGIIDSNENRQGAAANTEGCMAIKGWSVVALTHEEGEGMEQPDDPATIHEKLRPYVEAPSPLGQVLRGPFANELVDGDFKITKALDLEEVSMSVRATKDIRDVAVEAAGGLKPAKPDLPKGVKAPKAVKPLKSSALAGADPAQSYIAMRISYSKGPFGLFDVLFHRLADDGSEIVYDGAENIARTSLAKTGKGERGEIKFVDYVVQLPPGVWKMATVTATPYAADFCFGAPAFDIAAGETVFVGEMTIRDDGGYPIGGDIGVAKEILAANPALAEAVKPAVWANGFTSDCFGSYAYAYEIPGAPIVDMEALKRQSAEAPEDQLDDEGADTIASETAQEE